METIQTSIFAKNELIDKLSELIKICFRSQVTDSSIIGKSLHKYFDDFRDDIYCYLEYPYVDRVYRDSYYNYFSSKHLHYDRNCIRLSLFAVPFTMDDFRETSGISKLKESFLGYFVIRPTMEKIIGRSMVSPRALKEINFITCLVSEKCSINGVCLTVHAFPHSSQDKETITCAETTIWSVMEYFGNKYSVYSPVLPSEIIKALDKLSTERLIPSKGLNSSQISFALKEFGFGTKVYAKSAVDEKEFSSIFSYYIESGIPVIGTFSDVDKKIAHAVVYCGHEDVPGMLTESYELPRKNKEPLKVYDTAKRSKKYVSIDDNYRPYKITNFNEPASYYKGSDWKTCTMKSIIVPLYPRIYLEAFQAKKLVDLILVDDSIGFVGNELVLRLFLTSSRSYKNRINENSDFDDTLKKLLVGISMPKFIWIAELSTVDLYAEGKSNGYLILDATGAPRVESIVFIVYPGQWCYFEDGKLEKLVVSDIHTYPVYRNNLKGVWNKWQS
jgi:hypothetical protein